MPTTELDIREFIKSLQPGRIYFMAYGPNTSTVARYQSQDVEFARLYFFSQLYYGNGFESYHGGGYSERCGPDGISEIREATKPEKHNLFRHEVEHNTL